MLHRRAEEEAFKGVPQTLRDARIRKELCKRCGMDNHMWQFCRKEIIVSSTRKKAKKEAKHSEGDSNSKEPRTPSASSAGVQRKAPTNTAGDSKRARIVSSTDSRTEGPKRVKSIRRMRRRCKGNAMTHVLFLWHIDIY